MAEDSDEYILKIVQQQSKQSRHSRRSQQKAEKIIPDTANSTPFKNEGHKKKDPIVDDSDDDLDIEDLDEILE